jgi:hypothetical protein
MSTSFAGCKPSIICPWQEKYVEEYNDDGQLTLVSKKTYHAEQDEDIPEFNYKYVVCVTDMQALGSNEKVIIVQLKMVISPESATEEYREAYSDEYDFCYDLAASDSVTIGEEYIYYDSVPDGWYDYYYDVLQNEEVVETLNVCASVTAWIDLQRGSYLDKTWNMIGSNGWDLIRHTVLGKDWLKASIDRYTKGA